MNNQSLVRWQNRLLESWPAPQGFYVVPGTSKAIVDVEDLLVRFIGTNLKKATLPIGPVFWIDSGNYFNAYSLSDQARRRGFDPKIILRALKIARPFTAFQFQQMLDKVPFSAEGDKPPFVFISDLMGLFYDPDIQEDDLKRATREFLIKLLRLKRRAVVLSLLIDRPVPPLRASLLARILDMADDGLEQRRLYGPNSSDTDSIASAGTRVVASLPASFAH